MQGGVPTNRDKSTGNQVGQTWQAGRLAAPCSCLSTTGVPVTAAPVKRGAGALPG